MSIIVNAQESRIIVNNNAKNELSKQSLLEDYGAFRLYQIKNKKLKAINSDGITVVSNNIEFDALTINTKNKLAFYNHIPLKFQAKNYQQPSLHLIQFYGPIKDEWLKEIEKTGAKLVHYIRHNAYLIWANYTQKKYLSELTKSNHPIIFSEDYQPYLKMGQSISRKLLAKNRVINKPINVTIQLYKHSNNKIHKQLIKNLATQVFTNWYEILQYENISIQIKLLDIQKILELSDVYSVQEDFKKVMHGEVQDQIIAGNLTVTQTHPSAPGYLTWLDSYGFSTNPLDYPIIDITDAGAGNGSVTNGAGDFTLTELGLGTTSRIDHITNCTTEALGDDLHGHGHLNISIAGSYDQSMTATSLDPGGYQRGLGVNPYGRVAATKIFDNSKAFDVSNCGSIVAMIKSQQDNNSIISNHSWGSGSATTPPYDSVSQIFDMAVRDADLSETGNQPMTMVVSAGNNGTVTGSIFSPGNAKNVITVGASENQQQSDENGSWTDNCGIGPTFADNAMDVWQFSSKGPAPGARVKPETLAPGSHVQATSSTSPSFDGDAVCDFHRPVGQTIYSASDGTSHSAPAISAIASLYYYRLENTHAIASPSPSLIKAYIIAHPTYLTGTDANDTFPSNNQGYGMPNMTLAFDDTPRVIENETLVFDNTGENWSWSGIVADPARPVRIVLAYTDAVGAIGTSPQVNNLDLSANIDSLSYVGNNFSGQWSIAGGIADANNNYEAIFLPVGTIGNIDVNIIAANIAGDGIPNTGDATDQDFSLVCYNCKIHSYTVGGDVTGLNGSITLQNNGLNDITLMTDGSFVFPNQDDGTGYDVTILDSPTTQTCTVSSNGTGTLAGLQISNILVSCVANNSYSVGGSISGLNGNLILSNNNNIINKSSDGTFVFSLQSDFTTYNVMIISKPDTQTCSVNVNGSGTLNGMDVTDVVVTCITNTFTIGGDITGLNGSITLQNNGANDIVLTADGSFTFPIQDDGTNYAVTITDSPITQTCSLSMNATGTLSGALVDDVVVTCVTNQFSVGGNVTGLNGDLVLSNNGNILNISADGMFVFPDQDDATAYDVMIVSKPSTQSCTVSANGVGVLAQAAIADITITCATNTFSVGGNVSGLNGSITLQNNGANDIVLTADGLFSFPIQDDGTTYAVTITDSPITQTCSLSMNATGTLSGALVDDVVVTCITNQFSVGGNVTGLNGDLVLSNNGNILNISADGAFVFPDQDDATAYDVMIVSKPSTQSCTVSANGVGVLAQAAIVDITITCVTNTFSVGGNVSGLNGSITLQNNGADDITLTADGSFTFPSQDDETNYAVTILSKPSDQDCQLSLNATGNLNGMNIANIQVICASNLPTAISDVVNILEDSSAQVIDVLSNDIAPATITIESVTQASYGLVEITNMGADLSYTPQTDFCGTDSFTYQLNGSSVAVVQVMVECVNDQPSFEIDENTYIGIDETGTLSSNKVVCQIDFGTNENTTQSVQNINATINVTSDPILSSVTIANDGTISYSFTGNTGIAIIDIFLQDDGGVTNSGVDTSIVKQLSIHVHDYIYRGSFEIETCQ